MNKPNVALIMALPMESQGEFEKHKIQVNYSGLGKINATLKAAELILNKNVTHIINLGTAGSNKLSTHALVECRRFVQRDIDLTALGYQLGETPLDEIGGLIEFKDRKLPDLPEGICGTGDSFETRAGKLEYDVVDMESYALAKVCRKLGVDFTCIKYITDGANHEAHSDWRENLKPAASALLSVYQRLSAKGVV